MTLSLVILKNHSLDEKKSENKLTRGEGSKIRPMGGGKFLKTDKRGGTFVFDTRVMGHSYPPTKGQPTGFLKGTKASPREKGIGEEIHIYPSII